MKNFIEEMVDVINKYKSNEKLKFKVEEEVIVCYYEDDHFLDIGIDGWLYPINMNDCIELSNFKESKSAYKMFYVSEFMLRGIGILADINKEAEDE